MARAPRDCAIFMWSFEQKVMGQQKNHPIQVMDDQFPMVKPMVKPMVFPTKLGILHDEPPMA